MRIKKDCKIMEQLIHISFIFSAINTPVCMQFYSIFQHVSLYTIELRKKFMVA